MTLRDRVRQLIRAMNVGDSYTITTDSQLTTVRKVAAEENVRVRIRKAEQGWVVIRAEPKAELPFTIKRKEEQPLTAMQLLQERTADNRPASALHWEVKGTPFGKSGVAIQGLSWREKAWDNVPDFRVWNKDLGITFDPRHVLNPRLLSNSLTRQVGLDDVNIMLSPECKSLSPDDVEQCNKILEGWKPNE